MFWGLVASMLPLLLIDSVSSAMSGDSSASRVDASSIPASQYQFSDGRGLRACHWLTPGVHSRVQRRFTFGLPLNELLPFLAIFVDGVVNGNLAPFVSKHAPAQLFSAPCVNPASNVLVPPGERGANPRIIAVREPHDDGSIEAVIIEKIVAHTPHPF